MARHSEGKADLKSIQTTNKRFCAEILDCISALRTVTASRQPFARRKPNCSAPAFHMLRKR
eukprot:12409317-Karenia_brevis.AAC.1